MKINPDGIPKELRDLTRWMLWRGKKVPYQPNGSPASSTDPETWVTFDRAMAALPRFDGIAFALGEPYFGIDLDNCMDAGGNPYSKAAKIVDDLNTYTEVSPSGTGLHAIGRGRKPGPNCKKELLWVPGVAGRIEVYDHARYFCFTGNVSADAPFEVMECQERLSALYRSLWPTQDRSVQVARQTSNAERCHAYLLRCPDSISGQNGHGRFLHIACETFRFDLTDAERWAELRWWSANKSGDEPWNEREISHKIESARIKTAGEVGRRLREKPESVKVEAGTCWEDREDGDTSADLQSRFDAIRDGRYAMVPLGWPALSGLTQALLPGTITLVCSEPGLGKSFWLLAAAIKWQEAGIPYAMFELEEDRTYHAMRAAAMIEGNARMLDIEWARNNPVHLNGSAAAIKELGTHIYDAPGSHVSLASLTDWHAEVAQTNRVVVIDPITAASAGDKRWIEDERFIERAKRTTRETGSSLILVTHPKTGKRKGAPDLDDLAGGAGYARFTQTVLVLADRDPSDPVRISTAFGVSMEAANRVVHIRKARNGPGGGVGVAFRWDKSTLEFRELGVICGR